MVHEHVGAAGRLEDLCEHPSDLARFLEIGLHEPGNAARELDVTRRLLRRFAVHEEVEEDACPGLCEAQRDRAPDPAAAARDEDLAPLRGVGGPHVHVAHAPPPSRVMSIGAARSTRTVSRRRSTCPLSASTALTRAKSSTAEATRRPSTSAVALTVHPASSPAMRTQRTWSWSPGRTK